MFSAAASLKSGQFDRKRNYVVTRQGKFEPALWGEDLHCVKAKFFYTKQINFAFEDIIAEEHDLLYECWISFTAHQQNILRAVAAGERGLTTRETLAKFSLGPSGTVTNTVNSLIKVGHLIRQDAYTRTKVKTPTGYDFDSPFFKGWVVRHTLSDIGLP